MENFSEGKYDFVFGYKNESSEKYLQVSMVKQENE